MFVLLCGLAALAGLGCQRQSSPPAPLAIGEVPAELAKAFAGAAPGAKEIAGQVAEGVKSKDYPAAYEGVQILVSLHDATPEQRTVATRAMLSLTSILKDLQAKGDPAATAALQARKVSK